jgi:putative ABC transport system permease protein
LLPAAFLSVISVFNSPFANDAIVIRFLLHLITGHFRRHKLEGLLCLVGVALGVAVVVAMDAAVDACVSSFSGAVDSLAERSTHSIFAEQGQISDATYIALLKQRLPYPLAPMIDRGVLLSSPGHADALGRLIGVDVFSERSLRSFTKMQSTLDQSAFASFLTVPGTVVIVDALARQLGAAVGSALILTAGDRRIPVHVVGIFTPTGVARSQLSDLLVADLATAQELTNTIGGIDRIDTALTTPGQIADLTAHLPPGLVLRSTRQRAQSLAQLIGSYRLNLSALSLMASFVAVFIVYNSMLISVQQRAKSLGILRCLGASRWQLGGIYFAEALGFAAIGGILGVLGGWALSRLLVGYIATTINDLYAAVRPAPVTLDWLMWTKGLATALGSCLVGAAVPLVAAARTAPVNLFRSGGAAGRSTLASSTPLLGCGIGILGASLGVYRLPGNSPIAGFVMALMIAVGFALACPFVTRLFCAAVSAAARPLQWLPLQLAAAEVGRSLGITAVAVAATMLAMSMNIGIRTMVASFRSSLSVWLDARFAADVFVAPELLINHRIDATLNPAVADWVQRQPQTQRVQRYRTFTITVGGQPTQLTGADVSLELPHLPMKQRMPGSFDPQRQAVISEPLAGRLKLSAGDTLALNTPTGRQQFVIYGIFYDFGNEHGQVMLDSPVLAADWLDQNINDLHVTLRPGFDRLAVARQWNAQLRRTYPVVVNSYGQIKNEAMAVFDRTFSVTVVLTWLSGAVAFCGLAGSLLALALARRQDFSILAAVGMSSRQTAAWVLGQGILIAWASAAVAPVAGTLLAYVLAYVIQYRSFGWSIPATPQPRFWIENFLLATAAAIFAAVYPAAMLRREGPGGVKSE